MPVEQARDQREGIGLDLLRIGNERGRGADQPAKGSGKTDVGQRDLSWRIGSVTEVEDVGIELLAQVASEQRCDDLGRAAKPCRRLERGGGQAGQDCRQEVDGNVPERRS